ncbi:MAG: SDR family oxidoreductase [Bacteroidota bacterium]
MPTQETTSAIPTARVFVTGATGFIGSAITRRLLDDGYEVTGLARSDAAAETLRQRGIGVHRGDLTDPASLAAGARAADGVIHTAFIHDFSRYEENNRIDRRAVEAIADALEGSGKPFVATSATTVLAPGRLGTEEDAPDPNNPGSVRAASEAALPAARRGVRASVVRLPPSVHGPGDTAFVPALIEAARQTGVSAFVGEGENRWPAVHRLDAARLFRLAFEKAEPGTVLHGVAEEGIPMRRIAEVIGEGLGVPVRAIPASEAPSHFGWLAGFVQIDNPISSALTREWAGWQPQEADLLTDVRENGYFSQETE